METKKPVYVQGYVRNKNIQTKTDEGNWVALLIVVPVIILTLVVYWKFTVTMAGVISLAVFAKKYYQFMNDPRRLVVNYFGATLTERIWDNIKGMLREQLNA